MLLTLSIFIISNIPHFEISSKLFFSFTIFLFFTSLILLLKIKLKTEASSSFFQIIVTLFICLGIYFFQFWSDWKTQTIIYRHLNDSTRTIEFQISDQGTFGYSERTIEVKKYFFFIEYVKELDIDSFNSTNWEKVNLEINEAGLKGG